MVALAYMRIYHKLSFVEGWYVEWIKISLSSGRIFFCPLNKWLDSGPDAAPGKPSWTVDCIKSGRIVINENKANQSMKMGLWRNVLMRRRL